MCHLSLLLSVELKATVMHLFRGGLRRSLSIVQKSARSLALKPDNAEALHQLRVGLRKLRTLLSEMRRLDLPVLPDWEAQLRDTFRLLGAHRDWEILNQIIRPRLEHAGAPLTLCAKPDVIPVESIVGSKVFLRVLADLNAFKHEVEAAAPSCRHTSARWIEHRITQLHKKVLRDGQKFDQLTTEEQHRVRKRLKRLHFLFDLAKSLAPTNQDTHKAYLKRVKAALDALGVQHDLSVAIGHFNAYSEKAPLALFAAGYLQGLMVQSSLDAKETIHMIGPAPPAWAKKS